MLDDGLVRILQPHVIQELRPQPTHNPRRLAEVLQTTHDGNESMHDCNIRTFHTRALIMLCGCGSHLVCLLAHLHALELLLEALARGVVLQDQARNRRGQEPEEDLVPRVCMYTGSSVVFEYIDDIHCRYVDCILIRVLTGTRFSQHR